MYVIRTKPISIFSTRSGVLEACPGVSQTKAIAAGQLQAQRVG